MSVDDDAASIKCTFLTAWKRADGVLATTSFYSALSEGETVEPSLLAEVDGVMKEFCLDIDKLEKVASARKGGLACNVRRPAGFADGKYFLFRAEFVDNTSWDIIIPYPDSILTRNHRSRSTSNSPRTSLERSKHPHRMPKLISWSVSPPNEAGVVYFFVKTISGFEHWESSDWYTFAAEQNDNPAETELRRVISPASTILTNSSISSTPTRTSSQTSCTEESKRTVKSSKTSPAGRESGPVGGEKEGEKTIKTTTSLSKKDEVED